MIEPSEEIGSEYEWRQLPAAGPGVKLDSAVLTFSGRQALRLVADEAVGEGITTCLLPDHHCHSMVQPFVEAGLRPVLVKTDRECLMDPQELEHLAKKSPNPPLVLHCDTFGSIATAALQETLQSLRRAGAKVVVDSSHSFLGQTTTEHDYEAASLRKLLPLPDGGAVRGLASTPQLPPPQEEATKLRMAGARAKHDYMTGSSPTKAHIPLFVAAARYFDQGTTPCSISRASQEVLNKLNPAELLSKRKENSLALSSMLPPEFANIVNPRAIDNSPAFVVLQHRKPKELQKFLASKGIFCPIHWPSPPGHVRGATKWRDDLISIPVDHRYEPSDMKRVADALYSALEEGRF